MAERENEPVGRKSGSMGSGMQQGSERQGQNVGQQGQRPGQQQGQNVGQQGQRPGQQQGQGQQNVQGWNDFKTHARQKWNKLSDQDLDQYRGKNKNEVVGHISEKTGSDRQSIERDLDEISRRTNYRF